MRASFGENSVNLTNLLLEHTANSIRTASEEDVTKNFIFFVQDSGDH